MKKLLLLCFLFATGNLYAQEFQLAPPLVKFKSVFFSGNTNFEVIFNQPGSEIRYTLNGKEPTSTDLLYTGPVTISKSTIVKIRAIGESFRSSETATIEFVKSGKKIERIQYSQPNDTYAKSAANILNEDIGGFARFGNGTWLGYDKDSAELVITLPAKQKVNSVLMDMLADENSWIFLPKEIKLYAKNERSQTYEQVASASFQHDKPTTKQCVLYELKPARKVKAKELRLVVTVLQNIPDWHEGKGKHAWFFVDEIIIR